VRNSFPAPCDKCNFENASEARFCAQCAAPLDAAGPSSAEAEPRDSLTGERRHLTVLFCDLVGPAEIAARLDPEEWREIVAGYHGAAAQVIERFGGSVAQYLGDGVMAYFGVVVPHPTWEDFLRLAFEEIRFCGATSVQVMRRMRAMISDLIATLPPERQAALEHHRERLNATIARSFADEEEKLEASVEDRQGLGVPRASREAPLNANR
jgi:class 3 adenylate cyclase